MKKMTFAFACASAAAAFAWEAPVLNAIGFDDYTAPFTGLSLKGDNGGEVSASASFWLYEGTGDDGSTVKAYDPEITGNANYLELSTEGGTLWRSINTLADSETLGAAQEIPASTGLYVDTMVQFTPTEDGGAPETDMADKLAVWLNVDSSGATNLMVKASQLYTEGTDEAQHALSTNAVYVVSNPEVEIQAGEWHRLTVKVVKNVLNVPSSVGSQEYVSAFEISIDGKVMAVTGEKVATDDFIAFYSENEGAGLPDCFATGAAAALQAGTLIPSLKGYTEYVDQSALQAVGFKGSGAIDSLQFTTEDPGADPAGEFTVDWGSEGVQAVWGDTAPTTAELAAIKAWAEANSLSADDVAGEKGAAAYLLGLTAVPEEMPELKITAIEQTETGWTITIACDAQSDLTKINGSLVVKTAAELGGTWTSTVVTTPAATVAVTAEGAKFMKAAIGKPVPPVTED